MNGIKSYRVSSSEEVITHFQARLDRFSTGVFTEFGAVLVGDSERIDRLVFPESIIGVRDADEALENFSITSFPEVRLAAETTTDALYLKIVGQYPNESGLITTDTVIVEIGRAFFLSDIWDSISAQDRPQLANRGFGPDMTAQQWATQINTTLTDICPTAALAADEESILKLRELPISILRGGALGTNGAYHFMPEFALHALETNRFMPASEKEVANPTYCFGNVHIHSLVNEMGELERAVANIVGADVVRRNPSAPDIMHQRASNDIFDSVSSRYGTGEVIDAMYTFGGVITVDGRGKATGVRWWDFYKEGLDLDLIVRLNDAAQDELRSECPNARVIAEYYQFVDSLTTTDMPVYTA